MQKPNNLISFIRRQPRWRIVMPTAIVVIGALLWWRSGTHATGKIATFAARRGPLAITVLEGGSLEALESQESKCEVRVGYQGTKILKIVEEGYLVTEDDVKTNKVLVELDSSEIEKQIVQQEIQYQSALASLTDAQQNYEIQLNQNLSDIKAAEQKVRFARMDFDKFLGDAATEDIVKKLRLDELIAAATTNDVSAAAATNAPPAAIRKPERANQAMIQVASAPGGANGNSTSPPAHPAAGEAAIEPREASFQLPSTADIDFSQYAHVESLGDGEAKQKLRKFEPRSRWKAHGDCSTRVSSRRTICSVTKSLTTTAGSRCRLPRPRATCS